VKILTTLAIVLALSVAACQPAQAGPLARIAARIRHPFNGNGIPVVRRVTGGGNGGCANGSCR
jgi:hypothetical protein